MVPDVNRRPAAGQLPHLVDRRASAVEASFQPGRHLVLSASYLRTHLLRQGDPDGDRTVLDNHIVQSKVYVHVNRQLTLRAIVDYERVAPNPAWSAVRQKQPVGFDLLGSYELNPGTAIYVGYVDRFEPADVGGRIPVLPRLESVGRQAFVKVSWLFRQ